MKHGRARFPLRRRKLHANAGQTFEIELRPGIGSIVDAPTAARFIAHGANSVVDPVLNPEVAQLCNRAYSPGCGSASEMSEAEAWGVEIVKIFREHKWAGLHL